jgi:long-chain acyl-CoA synthetase
MSFWSYATEDPSYLALVEPDGTEHKSGELLAASNRLVHGLRALGLEKGDVVATLLPNGAPLVELYLAVAQAGWYLTPINYHLTAPEVAYIVGDCEAKAFVADAAFADVATAAADEAGMPTEARFAVGVIEGFRPYGELKEGQPDSLPDDRAAGGIMTYTAGTTGRPKGVRRPLMPIDPDTGGQMFFTWFQFLYGIQPKDDNVHLTVAPLYHTAVMNFTAISLHGGHTIVLMDKWTPEGTLERIERNRVTHSHMVPTMFIRMLQLPEEEKQKYDVSSLTHVIHSAAPCPIEVKRQMLEWWGPVIYEYYAATEGGGTLVTPEQWLRKPGTVGPPWPNSEIRILDDEGQPCEPGQSGTVWIKMGDLTFEYHKDKEKTDQTWKEGFFTVGDIGYMDEEGWLFLNDRKADVIISGGVNIYPAETEAALFGHEAVGDAAVIGVPDDEWGERVLAVIEPREGFDPGDQLAEEITEYLKGRLAGYKLPRDIEFVESLPRDPNGKLSRSRLREKYWAGRDRAI